MNDFEGHTEVHVKHRFLTPEWFSSYETLCAASAPTALADQPPVNLVVTGGDGVLTEVHLRGGLLRRGASEGADTRIKTSYDVAYAMLISGEGTAVMKAFASGKLRVKGHITRLMGMAAAGAHPDVQAFQQKVREMTQ